MPTPADVGRQLRRLRGELGQTQAETAGAIGVSRANLAQWESGRYLPSDSNTRLLDTHLRAGNALVRLVAAARARTAKGSSATADANTAPSFGALSTLFHQVGTTLSGYLIKDAEGAPLGWRHNLQKERHHTALSTAYGVKAMLVLGDPYVDFGALERSLTAMRSPHGGWVGRSGSSRAEITAAVLDALFRIGTSMSHADALALLERSVDDYVRTRPYLLSTLLQTVVRLWPDSPLAARLVDDLLATRLPLEGSLLWPEKVESQQAPPEPSPPHTARAVVALRDVLAVHDREDVREAVEDATQWIVARNRPDDGTIEELVRPRPDGQGSTRVTIRHFTSAWVVQALAGAPGVPVDRMNTALRTVWGRYVPEFRLWAWGNGDLPIWMTLDSVTALRSAAFALAAPPVARPTH